MKMFSITVKKTYPVSLDLNVRLHLQCLTYLEIIHRYRDYFSISRIKYDVCI